MTKINQSQGQQIRVDRASHHVLRQGAKSADVAHLQRLLASAGEGGPVTGKFDARTFSAVREYQRTRGLQVDGVVGPETWGSLSRKNEPPVPFRRALPTDKSRAVDGFGVDEASRQVAAFINGQLRTISVDPIGHGQFLRPDAASAFRSLQSAALHNGINLSARSGFRTMSHQREIYRTDALAAKPGYSNHQKGIAVDIRGIGGRGSGADRWMRENASRFGFRNLPSEFWHYDFVG